MLLSAEDVTAARLQVLGLGTGTKWDQNDTEIVLISICMINK